MLFHEVASRLEKRLGLGEFPVVRRRLFARLQRLCEQKGDAVLQVIAALVQESEGPKIADKGKYFCWVVKRRLEEAGFPLGREGAGPPAVSAEAVVRDVAAQCGGAYPADVRAAEDDMRAKLVQRARELRISRLRAASAQQPALAQSGADASRDAPVRDLAAEWAEVERLRSELRRREAALLDPDGGGS